MSYDLVVIGAGPGGYVAAERAAQGGLEVALVERDRLGGVCLNWGCIPTKALLASAKRYQHATHSEEFGVEVERATFNLAKAMARKGEVQDQLRGGIAMLMKKHRVEVIEGEARILRPGLVAVGDRELATGHVLVATGSRPAHPPIPGADLPHVVDSTGILQIDALPGHLAIVGGGIIGLEFAYFFAALGTRVTVVEMLEEVGGVLDRDLAAELRRSLEAKGVTFHCPARVERIDEGGLDFRPDGGEAGRIDADLVLLATGRVPNVDGLGLEDCGVEVAPRGVRVDERCRTNVPGIWACGDVTGEILLAHVASRQGEVVVGNLLGREDRMRYDAVPGVIYTSPEVAFCGLDEAAAAARGIPVEVAKWPLQANGRFLAEEDGRGLCKVVVHAETRQVLGVHLIGQAAGEIVHSAAPLIEMEARVAEVKELIFPHPTVSESIRDAIWTLS